MKKQLVCFICVLLFAGLKNAHSQIDFTDWQSGKKLYQIKDNVLRDWSTNEAIIEFRDEAFINSKTGERLYMLEKKTLSDTKTGKKLLEYKNGKVMDSNTGNLAYTLDHGDRIISDAQKGKRLFTVSQAYLLPEYFYMVLIASGAVK